VKLTRELRVAAPLEDVWAEVTEHRASFSGGIAFGLGKVSYSGRTALDDVDDDEHVAGFHVDLYQPDGYGAAVGTVTATLAPESDGTRVALEANLAVTGSGDEVAEFAFDGFAQALEGRLPGAERTRRRRLVVAGAALAAALLVVYKVVRR
jgi:carbon monoxide dehydrogenase subunit G